MNTVRKCVFVILRRKANRKYEANNETTIKNYALFLVGLFVASMGVALSTKAGLGTSPVAAVPYSVSIVNHALTFGWWLNIWSLLQVAVQVILLRKKCKPVEIFIQAVLALAFLFFTAKRKNFKNNSEAYFRFVFQ